MTHLDIRTSRTTDSVVLRVGGELDMATAPALAAALATCSDKPRDIEVDLQGVTFMACAGINALIVARRRARDAGVCVRVVRPSESVLFLLRAARVERLLEAEAPNEAVR